MQVASAKTPRVHEFQGDDVSLALRTLARSANLNMVVSDQVAGTVTMRIEDKSPREAIEIIASSKDLILDENKGILYVRPKNPPPPAPPKTPETEKSMEEALTAMFTPALTKFYDSLLDYGARPETAQKIAKAKKALYDALIVEGFTKDEAFRIILTNQELSIPNANK
jgi:type II secretory pathway component GspD/PulD (secretin)